MAWTAKNDTPSNVWKWMKEKETLSGKFSVFILFFTHLPQWLYGTRRYYEHLEKWGAQNPWNPANLFREPFHMLVGFLIALSLGYWLGLFAVFLVTIIAVSYEFRGNKDKDWDIKNTVDVFFWTLGGVFAWILRY